MEIWHPKLGVVPASGVLSSQPDGFGKTLRGNGQQIKARFPYHSPKGLVGLQEPYRSSAEANHL